jgi:hypothetical protein
VRHDPPPIADDSDQHRDKQSKGPAEHPQRDDDGHRAGANGPARDKVDDGYSQAKQHEGRPERHAVHGAQAPQNSIDFNLTRFSKSQTPEADTHLLPGARYLIILTPRLRALIAELQSTPQPEHPDVYRRHSSELLE